jgi:tRNA modification GTPase
LVGARTEAALEHARRLVAGELGRRVEAMRVALLDVRAEVEANLDFPEDVDAADVSRWRGAVDALADEIGGWLARFEAGRRMRERARVVIAGPANAGKSTLFNALLGQPRAIVADVPGTTRDYVEAELVLGPYACVLVDTAGLGESADAIERAGMAMAHDQLAGADVVVWVEPADREPVAAPPVAGGSELVRVESKRDLGTRRESWIGVALAGARDEGVERVRARLREFFARGADAAWIGLERHRDRAREASEELAAARAAFERGLELVAFHLGVAEARLGEIVGRSSLGMVGADVLDRIFARFCIGK